MERFYVYTPVAKGKTIPDKVERFIELLPFGEENAIKREDLVRKCIDNGLINAFIVDPDRAMRNLIRKAKVDYNVSITNNARPGDNGYYRPTKKDETNFSMNNKREKKKAVSTFRSNKINDALSEDFKHGRLEVQT